MPLNRRQFALAATSSLFAPTILSAQSLKVEPMISGLDAPWAFGFAANGILITERDGALLWFANGTSKRVAGLPEIEVDGQGGLLDLLVPRDFATSRTIFMTYAKRQGRGSGTAVMRAQFDQNTARLSNVTTIFEMAEGSSGGRHFGSRIVEARDGTLFISIGDRGEREQAQNPATHNGTIIRITKNGAVPNDNPFVDALGYLPEIWSYGHRNPQGMALDLSGTLWGNEHGARGGDEINRIAKGANFGWPTISYGRHYSGRKIGEGTNKSGLEQPQHYWDPSIAPSGYMIYSGKQKSEWRGHHFVGSLKFDYIARLSGSPFREAQQIQTDATSRVRDIREAPDGGIWFLSVGNGTLNKLHFSG
ncbi:PQQ-dependent sugar dehydrogenase [Planktotalea sp.]|uniref:PQQ-dependent sugar dehydrogenase n=1 Tax=Planktotalea sp. TaxID=2029877 RepID=UPI003F6B35DA